MDFVDSDGDGGTYSDELTNRYLWGQAVDQLLAQETVDDGGVEDVLYPVTDNLGSVRSLVEYDGDIVSTYSYDSYGNVTVLVGTITDTRYLFTGQEYDASTGLYYYDARWYDPTIGKFISEDPISFFGGDTNLYRYVGNNPLNYTDSRGWCKDNSVSTLLHRGEQGGFSRGPHFYTNTPAVSLISYYNTLRYHNEQIDVTAAPYRASDYVGQQMWVYVAAEGHHWVPKSVTKANKDILTDEAIEIFMGETSGKLPYNHGNHTWNGVTHNQYNASVGRGLKAYAKKLGRPLTAKESQVFVAAIASGDKKALVKLGVAADDVAIIIKWRTGFMKAAAVAQAAKKAAKDAGESLTDEEVKLIQKAVVNGEQEAIDALARKGKKTAAYKAFKTLGTKAGKKLLAAAAKKVIPGLLIITFVSDAYGGYTEGVPTGEKGVLGSFLAIERGLVMADVVEAIASPIFRSLADAIADVFSSGGFEEGGKRNTQKRFGELYEELGVPID